MSGWISTKDVLPSLPGWYPTLSNWRTRTLHEGAKHWLGTKWASSCPEKIEFFAPERFDDPIEAGALAYDLGASPLDAPVSDASAAAVDFAEPPMAAAAG
jgi:hypothetical protein